ncbi:calmodulin-regulated spectrin-associated protein 1-like, partial [Heterodontus francisci]|uniref:calmodulin-regulated spectrin-associated protein 1-like n=1 Tax=Heterodontus francisci TaxID=7792 RepID=UPI00355C8739
MEIQASVHSLHTYNVPQAKFRASVRWLHCKVLGTDVSGDLEKVFLEDGNVIPSIVKWLLSGKPYCTLLAVHTPASDLPRDRLESVIKTLVSKGVNLSDRITVEGLTHSPISLDSHQVLMDTLMVVWAEELISVDTVVCSVQRLPSQLKLETPENLESAFLYWIRMGQEYFSTECSIPVCNVCCVLTVDTESWTGQVTEPWQRKFKLEKCENRASHLDWPVSEEAPKARELMKDVNVSSLFHLLECYCPHLQHQ